MPSLPNLICEGRRAAVANNWVAHADPPGASRQNNTVEQNERNKYMKAKRLVQIQIGLSILLTILAVGIVLFLLRSVAEANRATRSSLDAAERQIEVTIKELREMQLVGAEIGRTLGSYNDLIDAVHKPMDNIAACLTDWSGIANEFTDTSSKISEVCRSAAGYFPWEIPSGIKVEWGKIKIGPVPGPDPELKYPKGIKVETRTIMNKEHQVLLGLSDDLAKSKSSLDKTAKTMLNISQYLRTDTSNSLVQSQQMMKEAESKIQKLMSESLPAFVAELEQEKHSVAQSRFAFSDMRNAVLIFGGFLLLHAFLNLLNGVILYHAYDLRDHHSLGLP
jgi:hypothetical protein